MLLGRVDSINCETLDTELPVVFKKSLKLGVSRKVPLRDFPARPRAFNELDVTEAAELLGSLGCI